MPITERHEAQGGWSVRLQNLPERHRADLAATGHLVVTDARLDVDLDAFGDQLLDVARWAGVNMLDPSGDDDTPVLEGYGLAWWLGDHDGVGPVYTTAVSLSGATFAESIRALLPAAITEGTLYAVAGTYTGTHLYQTARQAIDYVCSTFDATWRLRTDATGKVVLDAGSHDDLFGTVPTGLAARRLAGRELSGRTGLDIARLSRRHDIRELTRKVVLLAEGVGETVKTGEATYAGAEPYADPQGNAPERTRLVSESTTSTANATARAQLQLNRFVNPREGLELSLAGFTVDGTIQAGGLLDVYDPTLGLVDDTNPVVFAGQTIWPERLRVRAFTWPISEGQGVYFRTPAGGWLDLSDHVVWESGDVRVEFGGARTIRDTSEPVQVRLQDPDDGLTPATPSGLNVVGQSNYIDGEGNTRVRATVGWTTPILNSDGSTVLDGERVEVRYATTTTGEWGKAFAGWDEASLVLYGLNPGVGYDLQVRAVDQHGNSSAWSATVTFTAQPDTIPPSQPAAPSAVAGGPLRIQVVHNLGVAAGGTFNLEHDLDHLEVHVGSVSTFTPSTSTLVGKIAANVAHITLGIAVVGEFDAPDTTERHVKVVAVDGAGNASAASASVAVTAELIATAHIGNAQITNALIANLAVSTAKIADLAVTTAKINDLAVGTAKIASAAITNAKVNDLDAVKITAGTLDADRIGVKTLSAEKLMIGSFDNLIQNPGFETGTLDPHSVHADISISAGTPRSGAYHASVSFDSTPEHKSVFLNGSFALNNHVSAAEGDVFYGSAYARAGSLNGTAIVQVNISFYDETDTLLSADFGTTTSLGSPYELIENEATAPAGTAYVVFELRTRSESTSTTGSVRWDDCYARRKVGTAVIEDLAVTSAKIDDLAVTSAKIDSLAVTSAKIGSAAIETAKIKDAAVETLKIANQAVDIQRLLNPVEFDGGGASSSGDNVTTTWATKVSRVINVPSWAGEAQVMNLAHAGATNSTTTPAFLQVRSGIAGGSGGSNSSKRADGEWSGNVTAGNSGTVVAPGSTITVTCDARHDGSGTWSSAANSFDLEAIATFRR